MPLKLGLSTKRKSCLCSAAHPVFRTALGSHDTLDNLLFILTLADGTKGYEEAAVATHITSETLGATRRNLQSGRTLAGRSRCPRCLAYRNVALECWDNNPAMISMQNDKIKHGI